MSVCKPWVISLLCDCVCVRVCPSVHVCVVAKCSRSECVCVCVCVCLLGILPLQLGNSPLLLSLGEDCIDLITLLLDRGADVNCRDYVSDTHTHTHSVRRVFDAKCFFLDGSAHTRVYTLEVLHSPTHIYTHSYTHIHALIHSPKYLSPHLSISESLCVRVCM